MNRDVKLFIEKHKDKLSGRLLEVGGLDVNGNLRHLFPNAIVTDMREGPNVDVVCDAGNLIEHFGAESFDSVVSTEMLEHAENWREALVNMWGVLKADGWLVMTMASIEKRYHGYPHDYVRLLKEDILQIWPSANVEDVWPRSIGWVVQKPSVFNPWEVLGHKPRP